MRLVLKHVQFNQKSGSWTYRRGVPEALRDILGKREFKKKLGSSESEAVRNYDRTHKAFEAELNLARTELLEREAKQESDSTLMTPLTAFRKAREIFIDMGFDPFSKGFDPEDAEPDMKSEVAETIANKYKKDPETGHPIGVSTVDTELVRRLYSDTPPPAPPATFLDACEEYLENHVKGSHNAELKEQRFRRLISIATDVWGNNPELRDLTYHHGKDVLTYLEKETLQSAATRKRYLNDYRAMLNAGRPSLWIPGMVQGETHPRHHSHWKMGIVRIDGHPKACLRLYRPPSPGLNDLHVPTIITEQIPLYDSLRGSLRHLNTSRVFTQKYETTIHRWGMSAYPR